MTTSYPGGLDSFTNPSGTDEQGTAVGGRTHSQMHADTFDALEAVQAELGANPSAGFSTVGARFAAVEGDVSSLESTVAGLPGADTRVFDAVSYGALVDGSTDDTAAWQAAINAAAAAGGGVVTSSKNGVSVIAGALQDTGGANAQLTLPSVHVTSGEQITLVLRGLTPPTPDLSVIGSMVLPDGHLVLKSTLSSGSGAVIGVKGPSGSPSGLSNIHAEVRCLSVRMPSNPTNSGIDLRYAATVHVKDVIVDVGTYDATAVTEPTTAGSYGLRLPVLNNGARTTVEHVNVIGLYNGVEHSEHAILCDVAVWGCKVAYVPTAAYHASTYLRVGAYHCERVIKPTGAHSLDVWQLNVEHAASGWMTTDYDLDDPSNYLTGFVRWWAVLAGSGPHNSFTVNGGSNATTSRVGAALGAGGGGSTVYEYRDRLTAASGNTILTLGATPVLNSPQVWVNNTIKWPSTDYTIAGNVITLGSALGAGDVVLVHYRSTSSSASASALSSPSVTIVDNFNRSNTPSAIGTTSDGTKTWTQHSGSWGIISNRAYDSSGLAATELASINAGVADCTVSAKLYGNGDGSSRYFGLAGRLDSTGANGYLVQVNGPGGYIELRKWTASSGTALGANVAYTLVDGDTLTLVMSGSTLTVKVNGTTILTRTDSTYSTNTRHGIWTYTDQGRFDDFSIAG